MQNKLQHVLVGHIAGIYGVQGWLKIVSYTRPRENIFSYCPWLIKQEDGWREVDLLESRTHGKGLIAKLANINDRDEVRTLLDAEIAVYRSQLSAPEQGEYYWHDLLGLEVLNQQGQALGKVIELMETGANDVLVVSGQQRHLIPFVVGIHVLDVDLDEGVIRVDWEPEIIK